MTGRTRWLVAAVVIAGLVPGGVADAGLTACGNPMGVPPFAGGTGFFGAPYQIASSAQLAAITGDYLDCEFVQTANITLSGTWTPIGSAADVFRGVYDGAGFTISGLSIPAGDDYVGLFGAVHTAVIENVTLTGVSVVGDRYIGGLVGHAQDTSISNVSVSGAVSGNFEVGGIVGDLRADMTRSSLVAGFSSVTVTAGASPMSIFGGVVGFLYGSTLSVASATGSVSGANEVGGIAGEVYDGAIVNYVRASGAVSGDRLVGGLVGYLSYATLSDSYATGSVTGMDDVVGGAVGYIEGTPAPSPGTLVSVGDLERTYATGAVSASGTTPQAVGGLVGYVDSNGTVSSSHWNTTANPTLVGIGLSDNSSQAAVPGSPLTTLQTITTYSGWTIRNGWAEFNTPTEVWGICDGVDTPFLLWEYTSSPCDGEFAVTGFFQPVDMDGIENVATAGRVVPLKWRVLDGDGLPVSDPASFTSMTSATYTCPSARLVTQDAVERYVSKSGLRYLGDGYWQFNWATPKSYAGQCRTVTLTLSDGTTIAADFRFQR